jgi:hypothetical protein
MIVADRWLPGDTGRGIDAMTAIWAQEEVAHAELGDLRLNARFQLLLSDLGARPNLSIPAACQSRNEMEAAYRFFDNPKVTFDKILQPHRDQTVQRLESHAVVLLPQDTTEIDLTRPEQQVAGVGTLDGSRQGVLLHELHAFTTTGIPLGTVAAEIVNRTDGVSHAPAAEKARDRKHTPIEDKESMRWLTGLRAARDVAQRVPNVQCVCIGDSEADIYELLAEPRGEHPVELLIRACQDRALQTDEALETETGQHLRERVLATPVLYEVELLVRGRSAKTPVEDRARRQSRQTRQTQVEVRTATVALRPPWRHDRVLPPITVNVVLVREPNPPTGEPPVEWILLTTLPIDTLDQVRTIVAYYCVRWQIEILFRTLKSGCRIEQRRFEQVERMLPALGLYLIVSWRTMFVCHMGRSAPDLDCETLFEPSEWKAVWMAVHHQDPPAERPRLNVMVRLIASLGGYVARTNTEPGPQTVWIGLQRMYDLAWAWDSFGPGAKRSST